MSKKTPNFKARHMYSTEQFFTKPGIAEKLLRDPGLQYYHTIPVIVLPATPEAYEVQVEAMANASFTFERLAGAGYVSETKAIGELAARAALAAIGIKCPKRARLAPPSGAGKENGK